MEAVFRALPDEPGGSILAARPEITLVPALQGRLGLDLAWEHQPDLVLLDLHLPDIPGEECCDT